MVSSGPGSPSWREGVERRWFNKEHHLLYLLSCSETLVTIYVGLVRALLGI